MIQKKIDNTADRYMMMTNAERRTKLLSVKRAEEIVSAICFFLIYASVGMVVASRTAHMDVEFEIALFTVVLFIEVTICRSAKSAVPMWILLCSALFSTIMAKGMMIHFLVYTVPFIIVEIKMAAMKNIHGYPLFEDIYTDSLGKDMTADQLQAYEKRLYADAQEKEAMKERDKENLDKILKGEMDLDEFLGVEKKDTKNVKMDDYLEYHEPQVTQPEEPEDDDSAEAFFRRFEKKGGSLKKKKNESNEWLGGGDANSAESYFGKFSQSGGKLDDDTAFKARITFNRAKNDPSGGKDV